jgi:hypothetical protein
MSLVDGIIMLKLTSNKLGCEDMDQIIPIHKLFHWGLSEQVHK